MYVTHTHTHPQRAKMQASARYRNSCNAFIRRQGHVSPASSVRIIWLRSTTEKKKVNEYNYKRKKKRHKEHAGGYGS